MSFRLKVKANRNNATMWSRSLLAVLSMVFFAGCGSADKDQFKGDRGEVSGKVTVGGKPVPEGTNVVFQTKTGANYTAAGNVDANGEYKLLYNGSPNLPAVTYVATVFPPAPKTAAGPMTTDQMGSMAADIGKAAKPATPPAFNTQYSSALNSGLEFTVKKGKNTADFQLTQ